MEVNIYNARGKSQAGNIWVKDIITSQNDLRYSARDLKNIHTLPEIQQRALGPRESATGIM